MTYQEQLAFARAFGLLTEQLILDGVIHRTGTATKPRSRNGWYLGFAQPPFLIVGDWQTGQQDIFKGKGLVTAESVNRQRQIASQITQLRLERQNVAAEHANRIYSAATGVISHPYLTDKRLGLVQGLRSYNGMLLVPLYDLCAGTDYLVNIQQIAANGQKRFIAGGRVQGTCFPIGVRDFDGTGEIYIAEGVATAATVSRLTLRPTLAAMNASNLTHIAQLSKRIWPQVEIVIAADDDYLTELEKGINPGQEKALQAARMVGGKVSTPPFTVAQREAGLTDWNDYQNSQEGAA